jgi:hypothetical protein
VASDPINMIDSSGRWGALAVLVTQGGREVARRAAVVGAVWVGGLIIAKGYDVFNEAVRSNAYANEEAPEEAPAEPGTPESDKGAVYCCDGVSEGQKTPTGKEYVGTANDLGRRARTARDGREREKATVIGEYEKGDTKGRRKVEQEAINDKGGKEKLDNVRDEIRKEKWKENGIEPPK